MDESEDRKLDNVHQQGKQHSREDPLHNGVTRINGLPDNVRQLPRQPVSAMEQMVVNWHQLNGEMQRNGVRPPETEHRRPTSKRTLNGVAGAANSEARTKRRTPSEGDEDMTPGMWEHFTQDSHQDGRHWGQRRPAQLQVGRQDGMERYFNDNAHLLEHLGDADVQNGLHNMETAENTIDEGYDRAVNQSDSGEDDDPFLHDTEEVHESVMVTKLSTSSEDLGDFIETDISLPNQGSSYANSPNSSTEDLVDLDKAEECDKRPERDQESRRPDSLFTGQYLRPRGNFPSRDNIDGVITSDSSSSNYFSPIGDEDYNFELESNQSQVDSDNTVGIDESDFLLSNNNGTSCEQFECNYKHPKAESNIESAMAKMTVDDTSDSQCVNNLDYDRARVANLTRQPCHRQSRQTYNLSRSSCDEINQLSTPNSENEFDVYDSFISNVTADSFAQFRGERPHRERDLHGASLNIDTHSHANLTRQSSTSDEESPGVLDPVGPVESSAVPPKPPQYSDDESPSAGLRLLDYEFLDSSSMPAWARRHLNTEDSSPENDECLTCQNKASQRSRELECKARNVEGGQDLIAAAAQLNLDLTGIPQLDTSLMSMMEDGRCLGLQERCNHKEHRQSSDRAMIWCEYQAFLLQVKQIGASACGATAVINVLKAFDVYEDAEHVMAVIQTNLRAEDATVPEYLLSRSVAGTSAECLTEGIRVLTDGAIYGRFFSTWPEKNFNVSKWLCKWIKKGAVPLLTLNLQKGGPACWLPECGRTESRNSFIKGRERGYEWTIPDVWHHQMCYGVGPRGIYLTNPLEVIPGWQLSQQLNSDSELLVRRQDIVTRWHQDTDLGVLISQPDPRWRTWNVLGQVVNVLREEMMSRGLGYRSHSSRHAADQGHDVNVPGRAHGSFIQHNAMAYQGQEGLEEAAERVPGSQLPLTSHIRIPAWYRAGITLYVRRDSPLYHQLLEEPEFPDKLGSDSESKADSPESPHTKESQSPKESPAGDNTNSGQDSICNNRTENVADMPEHVADMQENVADMPEHVADMPEHVADMPEHVADMQENVADMQENVADDIQSRTEISQHGTGPVFENVNENAGRAEQNHGSVSAAEDGSRDAQQHSLRLPDSARHGEDAGETPSSLDPGQVQRRTEQMQENCRMLNHSIQDSGNSNAELNPVEPTAAGNPESSVQNHMFNMSNTAGNPESSVQNHMFNMSNTAGNPESSVQNHMFNMSNAAGKPESSVQNHMFNMSNTADNPESSVQNHMFNMSNAAGNPESSVQNHMFNMSNAAGKPESSVQNHMFNMSNAAGKPESSVQNHMFNMSNAAGNPESSVQNHMFNMSNTAGNPESSVQNQMSNATGSAESTATTQPRTGLFIYFAHPQCQAIRSRTCELSRTSGNSAVQENLAPFSSHSMEILNACICGHASVRTSCHVHRNNTEIANRLDIASIELMDTGQYLQEDRQSTNISVGNNIGHIYFPTESSHVSHSAVVTNDISMATGAPGGKKNISIATKTVNISSQDSALESRLAERVAARSAVHLNTKPATSSTLQCQRNSGGSRDAEKSYNESGATLLAPSSRDRKSHCSQGSKTRETLQRSQSAAVSSKRPQHQSNKNSRS